MADPKVIRTIIREGRRKGASRKEIKAAIAATLTESGGRNLSYGDRDSLGAFQIRQGIHPNVNARNVRQSAAWFFQGAKGKRGSAAQIAQAVERSAFPERYKGNVAEAGRLLRGHRGAVKATGPSSRTVTIPGQDNRLERTQVLLDYFHHRGMPGALSTLAEGLQATRPTPTITKTIKGARRPTTNLSGASQRKGLGSFEGVKVASWIVPELKYARAHGWKGKVNSGYRSVAEQRRIYNSGVRPAAKPGQSNHNRTDFPGGAVDVSDAQTLARILQTKGSPLKWAGGKDPVHFSHPHGGSY